MKVIVLGLAVVFGSACSAQTKAPATTHPTKTPLSQCRADLQDAQKARDGWADLNTQLEVRNKELESQNKELEAKNAEITQKDEAIKKAAGELLRNDQVVYPAAAKLFDDYNALVLKYNSLLSAAQTLQFQVNAANSRQQRINNALAIYSAMPKYAPPQTINLQVTNCNALPALCVH